MGNPLYVVIAIVTNLFFCRDASCYTKTSLVKKYIRIKNDLWVDLLIASNRGRGIKSDSDDRDKMCIIGLISYIYLILTSMLFLWGVFFQNNTIVKKMCFMIFWLGWQITAFLTMLTDPMGFVYGTDSDPFEERHWYSRLGNKIGVILVLLFAVIIILYEMSYIYHCSVKVF